MGVFKVLHLKKVASIVGCTERVFSVIIIRWDGNYTLEKVFVKFLHSYN